ncbi:hypothetical protein P4H46_24965, partial [Paenibacillus glucanolyticus]|uniref:hypothetical protein n=1 Tax=Paenibacillus glucanolyticus TaxID=59843 RepID=UPI0030C8EC3C
RGPAAPARPSAWRAGGAAVTAASGRSAWPSRGLDKLAARRPRRFQGARPDRPRGGQASRAEAPQFEVALAGESIINLDGIC